MVPRKLDSSLVILSQPGQQFKAKAKEMILLGPSGAGGPNGTRLNAGPLTIVL